jgi:hypothetical protein
MINGRKGKKLVGLWMTPEELEYFINSTNETIIFKIIQDIKERGDINI